MKKTSKKLLVTLTVLSMVLSLMTAGVSAAEIKTFDWETDLTISNAETGEIAAGSSGSAVQLLNTESASSSSLYYNTGDDYITLQTQNTYGINDAGAMVRFNFSQIDKTFELSARLSFAGQTDEISWRPYGYQTARGQVRFDKVAYFKNGNVYVGSSAVLTYDSAKTYDVVIRYQTATSNSASDSKIMISLSDGSSVSNYTGTPATHFSYIIGSMFVANKPTAVGINRLKIYNGLKISSLPGLPYFGTKIESMDFDDYSAGELSWTNAYSIPNSSSIYYTNPGNAASIVTEENGAYEGKSLKITNASSGSSQIRPQISSAVPLRMEFKIKFGNFGSGNSAIYGINNATLLTITTGGGLFFESGHQGVETLETGKWYMFRLYHNPGDVSSAADDYAYFELCDTDGKVTHRRRFGLLSTVGAAGRNYTQLWFAKDVEVYIDDLRVSEASAMLPSDSEAFGVSYMSPAYDSISPVYYNAELTFTGAVNTANFTADNIYICNDGTRVSASGYSWSEGNTVLSIPVNSTGHWRICIFDITDTSGNTLPNTFMEFDITEPKVVLTPSGNDMIATFKAKSSDIGNKQSALLVVAGYLDGDLLGVGLDEADDISGEVKTLTATLTGGNNIADVRAYVWESSESLLPIAEVVTR